MSTNPAAAQARRAILLVDDDPRVIKAWRNVFERANFRVEVSYQQGFTLVCGTDRADLILMDVNMPQIDGVALSQALQTPWPGERRRPPLYLFSSLPEDDLAHLVGKANAEGYISKLWPVARVLEQVRRILERRPV